MQTKYHTNFDHLLNPGHTACAGCGLILAMRHVIDAAGPNTIITSGTGCSEVTVSKYPMCSYKVPWVHSVFENCAGVASGVLAALKSQGKEDEVNVIAQGGDGATFDIGFGLISGMFDRKENILYVCLDNEGYMNTGYQMSGATPHDSNTTTSPPGKMSCGKAIYKKDMPSLAVANGCVYVATATVGDLDDLEQKVKTALQIKGPKYLQILTPCIPGWGLDTNMAVEAGRIAQKTGWFPVIEIINGKVTKVKKVESNRPKVEEYLKLQKRFKHIFKFEHCKPELEVLQRIADENVRKYNLEG